MVNGFYKASVFSEETQYTTETIRAESLQDAIDQLVAMGYAVLVVIDPEGNEIAV